jgi:circadian clock protein KaiC
MVVIKMRGGNHAKDIREYEITSKGVVILGERLTNYQALISGLPVLSGRSNPKEEPPHRAGEKATHFQTLE